MKQTITISLDREIIDELKKENNYSNAINEQLKAMYNTNKSKNLEILNKNLEESLKELKKTRKKVKEIKESIGEIKKKEKITIDLLNKNIYSVLSAAQVANLKEISNLDYETAKQLAVKFNLVKRGIGGIKLIKLWEEIKNVRK